MTYASFFYWSCRKYFIGSLLIGKSKDHFWNNDDQSSGNFIKVYHKKSGILFKDIRKVSGSNF